MFKYLSVFGNFPLGSDFRDGQAVTDNFSRRHWLQSLSFTIVIIPSGNDLRESQFEMSRRLRERGKPAPSEKHTSFLHACIFKYLSDVRLLSPFAGFPKLQQSSNVKTSRLQGKILSSPSTSDTSCSHSTIRKRFKLESLSKSTPSRHKYVNSLQHSRSRSSSATKACMSSSCKLTRPEI
jgi:hypothetical protein